MNTVKKAVFQLFLYAVVMALSVASLLAQIPNNSWRDHLAYNSAHQIAITPEKVFCAMNSGGMLSYHKSSNEITKVSKVTGLSDINISALAYSDDMEVLVIAYESGNIDLLTGDGVFNLPDIKNKRIRGSKTINTITVHETSAFLSCNFGIVHIDLERQEVKDTYLFGPNGSSIKVNDVAIMNNFIYSATEMGLYKADLNAPNLVDFNYWIRLTNLPESDGVFTIVEFFNNQVFTVYKSLSGDQCLRINNDDSWNNWNPVNDTLINSLRNFNNRLSVVTTDLINFYNTSLTNVKQLSIIYGRDAAWDLDDNVYAAADFKGFLKYTNGQGESNITVTGPRFNTTSYIHPKGDHVWIGSGSRENPYTNGAAYNFNNERWTTLSVGYTTGLDSIWNFYRFAYHPTNENNVFGSCIFFALTEIDDYQVVKIHDMSNTPVFQQNIEPGVGIRFMDIEFDKNGNLWALQDITVQPVFVLKNDGEWEHLNFKSSLMNSVTGWRAITVTENNQIWFLSRRNGITVIQQQADGSFLERTFSIRNQNNELLSEAFSMAEDKEGDIWIGTNKGPIVYKTGSQIFEQEEVIGNQILLPRNDGSGLGDFLLDYESVTDIFVDGGNRKWLATASSGAFLVSPDGKNTLRSFNEENSPLLSNNIISVGVHEKTGEVLFSTSEGLVGFMGSATLGLDDFKDVYVFPNPVRPGYEGNIIISGLIEDASVKITDISGNLVHETTSLGGQAVWNGKDFNGRRVHTGVYLVFMTNSDGSKTHITKLVFIH